MYSAESAIVIVS